MGRTITLYRGLGEEFDPRYDTSTTDSPVGYSTWTDNPQLARQYAGDDGYIYKIELPLSEIREDYIDNDGERALFFNNEKPCGLDGVSGDEYLVYTHHDLYDNKLVKLYAGPNEPPYKVSKEYVPYTGPHPPEISTFESFLDSLVTSSNHSLIESIISGYRLIFEAYNYPKLSLRKINRNY